MQPCDDGDVLGPIRLCACQCAALHGLNLGVGWSRARLGRQRLDAHDGGRRYEGGVAMREVIDEVQEVQPFAESVLDVSDGRIAVPNHGA